MTSPWHCHRHGIASTSGAEGDGIPPHGMRASSQAPEARPFPTGSGLRLEWEGLGHVSFCTDLGQYLRGTFRLELGPNGLSEGSSPSEMLPSSAPLPPEQWPPSGIHSTHQRTSLYPEPIPRPHAQLPPKSTLNTQPSPRAAMCPDVRFALLSFCLWKGRSLWQRRPSSPFLSR